MRICHVTSVHNSHDNRILKKECISLAKRKDFKVFLIAKGKSEIYNGVHIVGIKEKSASRIKRISFVVKEIYKKCIEIDADIYHLHDPELLLLISKLKKKGKKVIFDSHEMYYEQIKIKPYIPAILRNCIAYLYRIFENRSCDKLDAVIFPCAVGGKHPFSDRVKKCEFINNYPLLSEFNKVDINEQYKEKKEFIVCCVGSLTRERGILNLVKACNMLNIKLILGGEITPLNFKKELMSLKEFENIVDYRGVCDRDEVFEIYKSASVGASTILEVGQYSKIENFPTKVYEFMLFGLPFIISNFDYSKRIINEFDCGICVDPNDIEDIANKINIMRKDYKRAYSMGVNGRRAVEKYFNWEMEELKLYRLYDNL